MRAHAINRRRSYHANAARSEARKVCERRVLHHWAHPGPVSGVDHSASAMKAQHVGRPSKSVGHSWSNDFGCDFARKTIHFGRLWSGSRSPPLPRHAWPRRAQVLGRDPVRQRGHGLGRPRDVRVHPFFRRDPLRVAGPAALARPHNGVRLGGLFCGVCTRSTNLGPHCSQYGRSGSQDAGTKGQVGLS